jgi:hypothetical protein
MHEDSFHNGEDSTLDTPKYAVFKWEDYDEMKIVANGMFASGFEKARIKDAEVIRHQDVFAAPAFFEYAQSIRTAIEILEHLGVPAPDHLQGIADYFMGAGERASKCRTTKLPD